jgi:hypothetical protein
VLDRYIGEKDFEYEGEVSYEKELVMLPLSLLRGG